ncbi:MAG TPA: alpha/beta fold hydrolase [Anaerolineaceae bacterium]|nr:alpha/beta fold hydrolase [Anaerolineaceae bacterium]
MNEFQNPHLDGRSFILTGTNKTCVIMIHGFTATTIEVRPLATYLNEVGGYTVYAPLLPGHGTTPSDLNKKTWKDWVEFIESQYIEVKGDYTSIFLAGESMGGVVASYIASKFPEVSGVILYAPALKVENLGLSRFVRFFKNTIPKKSFSNDNKHKYPWQGYKVHPTNAAFQMYQLQKATKARLKLITQPTIIFHGKLDKTISSDSPRIIFDKIGSNKKEYIKLEKSGHTIILDQEFDFVARKTLEFLRINEKLVENVANY